MFDRYVPEHHFFPAPPSQPAVHYFYKIKEWQILLNFALEVLKVNVLTDDWHCHVNMWAQIMWTREQLKDTREGTNYHNTQSTCTHATVFRENVTHVRRVCWYFSRELPLQHVPNTFSCLRTCCNFVPVTYRCTSFCSIKWLGGPEELSPPPPHPPEEILIHRIGYPPAFCKLAVTVRRHQFTDG